MLASNTAVHCRPDYESLSSQHRYVINDAVNAILRVQAAFFVDIEPLELHRVLELTTSEDEFKYAIRQILNFAKDLKAIDEFLIAQKNKPTLTEAENVE
jgi:hypothetical protein